MPRRILSDAAIAFVELPVIFQPPRRSHAPCADHPVIRCQPYSDNNRKGQHRRDLRFHLAHRKCGSMQLAVGGDRHPKDRTYDI